MGVYGRTRSKSHALAARQLRDVLSSVFVNFYILGGQFIDTTNREGY